MTLISSVLRPLVDQSSLWSNSVQTGRTQCSTIREGSGFYRLEVSQGDDVTEVDFGADFRLLPIEQGPLGPTLSGEELAINKVLAVFGRAEARDFVDFSVLTKRYDLEKLMRRAFEKDPGFDPQVFERCSLDSGDFPGTNSIFLTRGTKDLSERSSAGRRISWICHSIDFCRRVVERDDDCGLGR